MKKAYIKPALRATKLYPEGLLLIASARVEKKEDQENMGASQTLSTEKIWGHGIWDDRE